MKGNIHKKITKEDKFSRKFYCNHARENQLRLDKKRQRKKFRRSSLDEDLEIKNDG